MNLNEEILRRGLGKTILVKGLNHDSKIYWKIHRRLLKAELTALKKGEGVWKEESEKESYLKKFKDSWREKWKKESYYDKFRRTKDNVINCSLILKFRELMSHLHFWKKE